MKEIEKEKEKEKKDDKEEDDKDDDGPNEEEYKKDENYQVSCVNLDHFRLRRYNELRRIPFEPLSNELMNDILCEDLDSDFKALLLEFRSDLNLQWKKFEPLKISVRMVELNNKTMEFNDSIIVQVKEDGKIGDLRQIFSENLLSCKNSRENYLSVRIFHQVSGIAMLLSDDNETIMRGCKIKEGDTLHVEVCDNSNGATHLDNVKDSLLLKKFDEMLNKIYLKYNKFLSENDQIENIESIYDQVLEIDVRSTLGELREKLALKLGVNVNNLVLRTNYNDKELKNNAFTLNGKKLKFGANSHVYCEKGKPLLPTEFKIHIYIEDSIYQDKKAVIDQKRFKLNAKKKAGAKMEALKKENENNNKDKDKDKDKDKGGKDTTDKDTTDKYSGTAVDDIDVDNIDEKELAKEEMDLGDAFLFVGSVILDKRWDMKKVKEHIFDNVANVPKVSLMRLREFNNNRLTRTYSDNKTLGKNAGSSLKDYKGLCIQKCATENELFDNNSLLLNVARWYPEKLMYSRPIEMSFRKHMKIKTELKNFLSDYSGIKFENLRCENPRPYLLKAGDIEKICILDWDNTKCDSNSTLSSQPWKCKSGDFILFKNNNEKELFGSKDFENANQFSGRFQQAEVPLVILTPEEQILKEEEEKRKRELQKQQDEKNRQDAQNRYNEKKQQQQQQAAPAAPAPTAASDKNDKDKDKDKETDKK